jgi:hypothetical protein
LCSGIALAFLSFFLNKYNVSEGVLWYVSQTLVYAGSIFGVSAYVNTKFGEIKTFLTDRENEYNNNIKMGKVSS